MQTNVDSMTAGVEEIGGSALFGANRLNAGEVPCRGPYAGVGTSRVLLADQHHIVRRGLSMLLQKSSDVSVVGEAADEAGTLDLLETVRPDVMVADMNVATCAGIDFVSTVVARFPRMSVIVLERTCSEALAAGLLAAGVHGFVLKHSSVESLFRAIRLIRTGVYPYVDERLNVELLTHRRTASTPRRDRSVLRIHPRSFSVELSPREREVLALIAGGARNRVIAERLSISPKTVETHRLNVINKLDAHTTAELVRWACRLGLIEL